MIIALNYLSIQEHFKLNQNSKFIIFYDKIKSIILQILGIIDT